MAEIALAAQVFVASSSDVHDERQLVRKELKIAQKLASSHRILLRPFLWEHSVAAYAGSPQPPLTEELKRSEFAIVIVWSKLGEGTKKELELALDPRYGHRFDNVAIYFKTASMPAHASESDVQRVQKMRHWIHENQLALTRDFESAEQLRSFIRPQLNAWLGHYWIGLPEACEYAFRHSGPMSIGHRSAELRWTRANEALDCAAHESFCRQIGKWAVDGYAQSGAHAALAAIPATQFAPEWKQHVGEDPQVRTDVQQLSESFGSPILSPKPLRRGADGEVFFSDLEWFYFFCSYGLVDAIQAGNLQPIASRPFVNPVHQYLKGNVAARGLDLSAQLVNWLLNQDGSTRMRPTVRNFSAYVLGMLEAHQAADAIAEALQTDADPDVRTYCITTLGKLGSRRHRPLLLRRFAATKEHGLRLLISQALCRMVGVGEFEL